MFSRGLFRENSFMFSLQIEAKLDNFRSTATTNNEISDKNYEIRTSSVLIISAEFIKLFVMLSRGLFRENSFMLSFQIEAKLDNLPSTATTNNGIIDKNDEIGTSSVLIISEELRFQVIFREAQKIAISTQKLNLPTLK